MQDKQLYFIKLYRESACDLYYIARKNITAFGIITLFLEHCIPSHNVFIKVEKQDLANWLGVSRQTVSTAISFLIKNNVISYGDHKPFGRCFVINTTLGSKGKESHFSYSHRSFLNFATKEQRQAFYERPRALTQHILVDSESLNQN